MRSPQLAVLQLHANDSAVSPDYKFSVYVRIMRNLLEEDEAIQAMQFLNRANLLIHETKNDEAILFFKLCQARILDATRKFLEAATKYCIPLAFSLSRTVS